MPKTLLGKLSVVAVVTFFACFGIFLILVGSGETGGDTFLDNLKLAIPMILAIISVAAAFISGILAVLKNKERAILVYVAIAISFLPLVFVLGEIASPH